MPINRLISANINLTPEQRHVLELAFNRTLRKLNLVDRNDPLCEVVARKIVQISLANPDASDPLAISEKALRELRIS